MSSSLLYHAFGLQGYHYESSDFEGGTVFFTINQDPIKLRCSVCKSYRVIRHGETEREFKSLPIGKKSVIIRFGVPRVECRDCEITRQVNIGFADCYRSYTSLSLRFIWN